MARFEVRLPKMGESVAEATITTWLKNIGDPVEMDEAVVEIATDKVDSEVPSEVEGTLVEIMFDVDAIVKVGEVIAIIETGTVETIGEVVIEQNEVENENKTEKVSEVILQVENDIEHSIISKISDSDKFFSPLVRNIAAKEGVSLKELEELVGTGKDNRVTKDDILGYISSGRVKSEQVKHIDKAVESPFAVITKEVAKPIESASMNGGDEIIEMTRMGKLIAHHMVASVQTSAHVQSFIEVDVTNIVKWRDKVKDSFFENEGEKITFTPIFMHAVAKAIKTFPMINISVDGDNIIKRKAINLGMAASLENGNLIVPVIKNADQLNIVGMTKAVNDLANRARKGQLKPDDIQGGTYTVTNVGSFGSVFGTPIINQPQVAILALGAVRKVPAVIETPDGDFIGIRHKMFISHSYDHRVVNGALGGMFIKKVKELLEAWDGSVEL
ncbi:dihydrolipoamide acetyltransferase family protein [Lutibacter sp.]|uniref:dihydrolipoamide acetyltransferase family protein n=1 Tax=Lutibacter sp. TaxID=1925666 RepID=UPI002736B1AE|nr:dihydrolipoamide acetyltransferase family protein [Lutibacter sp.]MDP3313972.1 dihydrolipoamide acetyltransferase family protein [Lutibacter sp.]